MVANLVISSSLIVTLIGIFVLVLLTVLIGFAGYFFKRLIDQLDNMNKELSKVTKDVAVLKAVAGIREDD